MPFLYKIIRSPSADLESSRKQVEADKKAQDELIRERDLLNKVSSKAQVVSEVGITGIQLETTVL